MGNSAGNTKSTWQYHTIPICENVCASKSLEQTRHTGYKGDGSEIALERKSTCFFAALSFFILKKSVPQIHRNTNLTILSRWRDSEQWASLAGKTRV